MCCCYFIYCIFLFPHLFSCDYLKSEFVLYNTTAGKCDIFSVNSKYIECIVVILFTCNLILLHCHMQTLRAKNDIKLCPFLNC